MNRKTDLRTDAVMRSFFGLRACAVCLAAVLMAISGCAEHKEEQASKAAVNESQSKPSVSESQILQKPPLESSDRPERAEVQETTVPLPGSGQTSWAPGFEGELIMGLDGGLYLPYSATTIRQVQSAMKNRGLYSGPLNGVLDAPTMGSLYTFQEATDSLQRCGVPTPNTRNLLEQGSHTDIAQGIGTGG
jgi:hypothetical protein